MTTHEMTIETELAGSVRIRIAEPFNIELEVYPKLYGALALYARKYKQDSVVDFASQLLRKHLEGSDRECGDVLFKLEELTQEHQLSIEEEAVNQLANALTIIQLREYIFRKKVAKRK